MGKYAAKIHIGWVNKWFVGDTPAEIIQKVEEYQDFDCLLGMGRAMEGKKGQQELDKLSLFLNKYHLETLTMEDIKNLNVKLKAGGIVCEGIAEGEDEVRSVMNKQ